MKTQQSTSGKRALVIGASGGIGRAIAEVLSTDDSYTELVSLSRVSEPPIDITNEDSVAKPAEMLDGEFDLIFNATGFLSNNDIQPEKSLRAISVEKMSHLYAINTIGPVLLLKHFNRFLPKDRRGVFASLSARVGSIGDNKLGGWYAYRASKAAQNMVLKTASIEIARNRPQSIVVALHPGTVATALSDRFAGNRERLTPQESAKMMLGVIDTLKPSDTGSFFDYRGDRIEW